MTSRVIDKFEKEFKYLEKQFSFIKQSYYTKQDLQEQIQELVKQIEKRHHIIEHQNQLASKRKKFSIVDPLSSSNNHQFAKTYYLKQIKKPLDPYQTASNEQIEPKPNQNYRKYQFESQKQSDIQLYPNRQISLQINIQTVQPIVNSLPNSNTQVFPQDFTLHLHHLNNHLITSLHYNQQLGLHQTGSLVEGQYLMTELSNPIQHNFHKLKRSTKTLLLKYVFRHSNIEMQKQLLQQEQNQNLIFSLTNSKDNSGIVIAMAKVNFNQLVFQSHKHSIRSQTQLINKEISVVLHFRKLISFGQVCPIEQLPLMCKLHMKLKINEEILSPPVQDFKQLFYHSIQEPKDKSIKKQQKSKSPRKILNKTPQKRNIYESSAGKSPHHKRSYVKQLLDHRQIVETGQDAIESNRSQILSKLKNTTKYNEVKQMLEDKRKPTYQKLVTLDDAEIYFAMKNYLPLSSEIFAYHFPGQFLNQIEPQITLESIDVNNYENVHLNQKMLQPIIQIHKNVKKNILQSKNQNDEIYQVENHEDHEYFPEFSVKLKAKISLKDKNTQGKLLIKLPFIQKLNRMFEQKYNKKTQIPSTYQIKVLPNTTFQIQEFQKINQEIQKRLTINKSHSKGSSLSQSKLLLSNKIIRLDNNIYALSESLLSVNIVRSLELHSIQGGFICVYNFNPRNKQQIDSTPQFYMYPFCTVFKVVRNLTGNYSVFFQVNPQQYLSYATTIGEKKRQEQNLAEQKPSKRQYSVPGSDKFIYIEMAISCNFILVNNQTLRENVKKQQKQLKNSKTNKQQQMKSSKQKVEPSTSVKKQPLKTTTEVQFFKAKLYLNPKKPTNSSYRQVEIDSNEIFCHLQMKFLSKENISYNIQSQNPSLINVVNGTNYNYSQTNDRLILQLENPLKQGQKISTSLLVEDWESGTTSLIQLLVFNRVSNTQNKIPSTKSQVNFEKKESNVNFSRSIQLGNLKKK